MTIAPSQTVTLGRAADAILKSAGASAKPKWIKIDVQDGAIAELLEARRTVVAQLRALEEAITDAAVGPLAVALKAQPGQDVILSFRFGLAAAVVNKADAKAHRANTVTL